FRYAFDCAGGALSATYTAAGPSASTTCTYADGPSTHTVSARILDKDGGFTDYTTSVTVSNAAPVVAAPADQSANEGASTSVTLRAVSDAAVNDNAGAVDVAWGDASPHTIHSATTEGALGNDYNTSAADTRYTVTVKVTDKDGGTDSKTFKVTVA